MKRAPIAGMLAVLVGFSRLGRCESIPPNLISIVKEDEQAWLQIGGEQCYTVDHFQRPLIETILADSQIHQKNIEIDCRNVFVPYHLTETLATYTTFSILAFGTLSFDLEVDRLYIERLTNIGVGEQWYHPVRHAGRIVFYLGPNAGPEFIRTVDAHRHRQMLLRISLDARDVSMPFFEDLSHFTIEPHPLQVLSRVKHHSNRKFGPIRTDWFKRIFRSQRKLLSFRMTSR